MSVCEERTPERLLLIGCSAFAGIDCISWNSDSIPNIPDYDIVIMSVPHLTSNILADKQGHFFDGMKQALVKFLHSKGKLIVLATSYFKVRRESLYPEYVSNFDWCPILFGLPNEAGSSIINKFDMYSSYLKKLKTWSFYFTIPKNCLVPQVTDFYGSIHNTRYHIPLEPYLANRYGRVLAGECRVEVTKIDNESRYMDAPSDPDIISGSIILLPLIDGITPEEALSDILREEIGYSVASVEPDWAREIKMPFVDDLETRIEQMRKSIQEKQDKISTLSIRINEINSFRRMLYGSGQELEDVVKSSFRYLGANISPAKYGQEEYILEINDKEYLVEVKGVTKSIALSHLRQLNDYMLKYQEDTGNVCKGILFGNAWRHLPPPERGAENTPEFPDNVIQRAQQWNISLVSSRLFFYAFVKALLEKKKASQILDAVITANGVADL